MTTIEWLRYTYIVLLSGMMMYLYTSVPLMMKMFGTVTCTEMVGYWKRKQKQVVLLVPYQSVKLVGMPRGVARHLKEYWLIVLQ